MTLKEQIQEASELEAKAKAKRREIQKFWKTIDENKEEILSHFGEKMSDTFSEICARYGATTVEEKQKLLAHLMSDRQVEFYQRINAQVVRNEYQPNDENSAF